MRPIKLEKKLDTLGKQEYALMREGAKVLEADHFGEKVLRLTDGSILKLFRRRGGISSDMLYPYARRFVANARTLSKKGIPVPQITRLSHIPAIERDAVQYLPLAGCSLRELYRQGLSPQEKETLKLSLTRFVIRMHDQGIYFRSLHLGNVILMPDQNMGLIDFADLRVYPWKLGRYLRGRNMRRMLADEAERDWVMLDAIVEGKSPPDQDDE